jgi:NADPH:quinone reductase-like Zn-dependent oxidoreductase
MHAMLMHETGGPEVLQYEEAARPEPADGQVLLRVRAAAVNPTDWKSRRGPTQSELPLVLGHDVSGTVETSRSERFAPGDDVFGLVPSGGYAEFVAAPADAVARKPEGLSHEQAAAIPVAGLTAWQSLFDRAGLDRGQTVLITGAAGGVGHFAVQFAKLAGARVIGTGSSRNRDFVLGLGADEYVDYTQQDVASEVRDVDVAFDTVGVATEALVQTVREGGILVTIASAPPEQAAGDRGVRAELHIGHANADQLARIAESIAAGEVRVELAEVLPLTETRRAHELSESGHTRGKIVLTVE